MQQNEFLQLAFQELERRYPQNAVYEKQIDLKTQELEIESLKKTVKYEQFFFVVNLLDRKLEYVNGCSEWLGYSDETFSIMQYFKIIHPRHFASLSLSANSAFETANSNDFSLKFMSQRVVLQVPLLHSNGSYLLTKRTLYPFQIDKSGKVLSYLNHFVVLKEYEEFDVLDIRVGNENKLGNTVEQKAVKKARDTGFLGKNKNLGFNKKELSILSFIAAKPSVSLHEIAETLGINLNTLQKTDNIRILNKAREKFKIEAFSSLKEVAQFMMREGIIN
jgi:hypothetical protein